jgi:hypothetical protein
MILPSDGLIVIVPRDRLHNSIAPSFVEAAKHIPDAVQAVGALRGEVAQHAQPCTPTAVTVEERDGLLVLADGLDGAADLAVLGEKASGGSSLISCARPRRSGCFSARQAARACDQIR